MLLHSLVWISMSTRITKAVLVPVLSEVCVFGISWILEITSDPSSELLFFISVPKVTSIAHNQSIISDSLLKMTARFWLFSESTFPKVKSGSVSLNLESLRVIFLQETTKPWRLLHLNLLPPHFLSESEIHFLKPQNAQSLT